ncbi:MAG: Holliday junction branch migration protein RuvA [Candidatus Buchananbacteria bacterium]|nr:Holliday junction branch migration protein RuvA [Candidatus Buchananbacteria bacterium]
MISYLKGKISYIDPNFIEIINNDVGYKIFVANEFSNKIKLDQEIEVFCFQSVKEDALDLYGFESRDKLYLFEKLVSVSGIGPKTALGVLSLATVEEIESAIMSGDASILTKVSGIGKKTAERIVLELKNKFSTEKNIPAGKTESQSEDADVIDGLVGLGYPLDEARDALRQIDKKIKGGEQKIKACLKILSK